MQWLNGQDPHSVSRQIYSMLWDYALFCSVNELRRIAVTEPESGTGFNGPVIRLFDAGFVAVQATTIRRLIEEPKSNPKLAVISLRSILRDIMENTHLLTRENYVCYDGLPYDHETAHQQWLLTLPRDTGGVHSSVLPASGPTAWHMSRLVHESFDRLSGASRTNRKRTDTIRAEIFASLESQINSCRDIKTYVDKFIAHASASETRIGLSDEQQGINLDRLKAHHKTIYQVAGFISAQLLYETNLGGLPVPQFDHLENLDKSWTTTRNLKKAREKWDEYAKEVSEWDSASLWPPTCRDDETSEL